MYRFWDVITEPLLEALRPEVLVEIGSGYGRNTRNLLEYCRRHDARLHVIDPLPKYDVAAWQEEYGERLIFHKALSLEALPNIEGGFDAVLIDGDHNWYTVYNELKMIEERSEASSRPFPLVMLHDIGWPYARRDGYYNPGDIPEEYLQPYERKGIRPGSAELLEEGGYNWNLANATFENGLRNGVLTAGEDFLEETGQEIELLRLSGLHGLGILVPSLLKQRNAELAGFLETLKLSPTMARYVELLENARLEAQIGRLEAQMRQLAQARRNQHLKQQLEDLQNSRGWRLLTKLDQLRAKVLTR
jgi:SAM-dependent methyltransferase